MNRNVNVLVFPCGTEIGLELHRSLADSAHVTLYGASSVPDHGRYLYARYREGVPFVGRPGFIDALNRIIDTEGIDLLIPAHDSVVVELARKRDDLRCAVVGSPLETCEICRSKRRTIREFQGVIPVPRLYDGPDAVDRWPAFLKPEAGQGSRGVHMAETPEDIRFYRTKDPSLLIIEYLPGSEYTIDCFTDRHGELRFAGARERVRIQNGISVSSRMVRDAVFMETARRINDRLSFRGVWFFQMKRNGNGTPVLMEIAPRVAGTMALYRNMGVNFALMSIFDALDMDLDIRVNDCDLVIDRALTARFRHDIEYRHLVIDLDDCLIMDGRVNTRAVRLVFQCLNGGVGVHLVTRHDGPLDDILDRTRLAGLFDSVHHLSAGERKSDVIPWKDAVFIDDSFAERKQVSDALGIPVFAPDAIECLLNSESPGEISA